MRICIVGCGAIGSLFAAHLAKLEDVEVWAYDLDSRHVNAINANGLRLSGESNLLSYPRATTVSADIPPCEFGIVATKSMHTRAAIESTAGIFKDEATPRDSLWQQYMWKDYINALIQLLPEFLYFHY